MPDDDVYNGYRLVTRFHNIGGGQCQWAFAERGGTEYFIKRFLSPTYPLPDGPGSEETKARKMEACREFEARHRSMMSALAKLSKGGSLIVAREFFRVGARYYKVTDKVDVSSTVEAHRLPIDEQLLLAAVVAFSLGVLHRASIVHGDLKPSNVLLKETDRGVATAKLIDFDDSYFDAKPPPPEALVGDFVYYSPETHRYVLGEGSPEELTTAADIFSLGILLTEYFTGHRPSSARDPESPQSCAISVLNGEGLTTGLEALDPDVARLVSAMLASNPADRPTASAVLQTLKEIRAERTGGGPSPKPRPPTPAPGGSRLKGSLAGATTSAKHGTPSESGSSRLRGSLSKKPSGS